MKKVVISLSGGLDSTALLLHHLRNGYEVYALSFDYGQKHKIELEKLDKNLKYLKSKKINNIQHHVIDISIIGKLFNSALTSDNIDIPEGHFEEEKMKDMVVPNRNAIFSSILYGYALSLSNKYNENVMISLGVHSGDHSIYPDCRPEFYLELKKVFDLGNWGSEKTAVYLPYLSKNKFKILKDLRLSCDKLKLNFNIICTNTNTCYNPSNFGIACGKCGTCIERIEAFISLGIPDPLWYKNGWKSSVEHCQNIMSNFKKNKNGKKNL